MSVPTAEIAKPEKKIVKMPPQKAHKRRAARSDRSMAVRLGERPTEARMRHKVHLESGVMVNAIRKEYEPESPKSRVMILRYRNGVECLLDYYLLTQKIDVVEYKAGMRFRDARQRLFEGIHTSDSLNGIGERIDQAPVKTEADLMKKLNVVKWAQKTLNDVYKEAGLTPAQVQIVIQVCGSDEKPGGGSAGLRTLHRALDKMARFWKITADEK